MSYDLAVYLPCAPEHAGLREMVSSIQGLGIEHVQAMHLSVVQGAKRTPCFQVDGPMRVEAEDVPEAVTAAVLGVTRMYQVLVANFAPRDVARAVRFARRLARRYGGAVVDQQTGLIWAPSGARRVDTPSRRKRIRVVTLSWYATSPPPPGLAQGYLALCRRLLPEALPRRFGEFEPLQGSLATAGDRGFVTAWQASDSALFFAATSPCIGGSLSTGTPTGPRRCWTIELDLHEEPLLDVRWREAVRRLFVGVAELVDAFFAAAEVTRGHIWSGRGLWSDADTESAISPLWHGWWMGLPPYPVWWSWYGRPYRDLVREFLPDARDYGRGLFHECAETPADRDELTRLTNKGHPGTAVLPAELLVEVVPHDWSIRPVPIRAATRIPTIG